MNRFVYSIPLAAVCLLLSGASATIHGDGLGASVSQQLAQARTATVTYHNPDVAEGDLYTDLGPNPLEGGATEYVNFNLIDCTLDAAHPEALRYVESGNGLRLVALEYSIPMACTNGPPEDFLPGAGEWEQEPGVPAWSMAVYVWSGKSQESSERP